MKHWKLMLIATFLPWTMLLTLSNEPAQVISLGDMIVDHIVHLEEGQLSRYCQVIGGYERLDELDFENMKRELADKIISKPGGSAGNTLKGLAALGSSCRVIGVIGDDNWGKFYQQEMEKRGVQTQIDQLALPTAQAFCLVDPSGNRSMRMFPGATKELGKKTLYPEYFAGAKLVHFDGYTIFNFSQLEQAMKLAKKQGAKVSLDLGSYEIVNQFRDKFTYLIKSYVDVLFGNQEEAQALLQQKKAENLAGKLKDWVDVALVHNGDQGFWVASQDQEHFYPALKVKNVVDTTGAGDLFASGFLHGYINGMSLEKASKLAAFLGALAVQVDGGELPEETWHEVRPYLSNKGERLLSLNVEQIKPKYDTNNTL